MYIYTSYYIISYHIISYYIKVYDFSGVTKLKKVPPTQISRDICTLCGIVQKVKKVPPHTPRQR